MLAFLIVAPGSGTLRVHRGSHSNWTESNLSTANAPSQNGQVGSFTGTIVSAQTVSIDVTPVVTGDDTYSLLVTMDSGGNDIWFGSLQSTRKPQLIVETAGSGVSLVMASSPLPIPTFSPDHSSPIELRFARIPQSKPTLQVTWLTGTGVIYDLEQATSLDGAWKVVATLVGDGETAAIIIEDLGNTPWFRRVTGHPSPVPGPGLSGPHH